MEKSNITIEDSMNILRKAIEEDPTYAWGWHSIIACCAMDVGLNHEHANKAAGRFMYMCFGVNTINNEHSEYKGQ